MTYIVIAIAIIIICSICLFNTRGARLRRLANNVRMRYDAKMDYVLTEEAQQASLFFQQGVHRFSHVLTIQESAAFMRLCEDDIFSSKTATAPELTYTLVTAELVGGTFTPLILMPRRPGQTDVPHPALPAHLAQKYVLSAPDKYCLPESVLGFLQSAKPCYLELTPTALIYHEFDSKPVTEIQPMRFRVRQLLNALVHKPAPVNPNPAQTFTQTFTTMPTQTFTTAPTQTIPAATATQTFTTVAPSSASDAELQAMMMLKMQSASRSYSRPAGQGGASRWIAGFIFVIILLGMCLLTAHLLPQFLHK